MDEYIHGKIQCRVVFGELLGVYKCLIYGSCEFFDNKIVRRLVESPYLTEKFINPNCVWPSDPDQAIIFCIATKRDESLFRQLVLHARNINCISINDSDQIKTRIKIYNLPMMLSFEDVSSEKLANIYKTDKYMDMIWKIYGIGKNMTRISRSPHDKTRMGLYCVHDKSMKINAS